MGMRDAVVGLALALLSGGALAQETPEAAYAQLHAATLAGKIDAALGFVAGPLRADLAAKPQAEREGLFRTLAQTMPKTYRVLNKSVDGDAAQLIATGVSEYQGGRTEAYLSASLRKEGETWKVASWVWSSQKPAALLPKPAAAAAVPSAPQPKIPLQDVGQRQVDCPDFLAQETGYRGIADRQRRPRRGRLRSGHRRQGA